MARRKAIRNKPKQPKQSATLEEWQTYEKEITKYEKDEQIKKDLIAKIRRTRK